MDDNNFDTIDYIAYSNPEGVKDVLHSFGYPTPKTDTEAAFLISKCITENGTGALDAFITVHPDYGLITEYNEKTILSAQINGTTNNQVKQAVDNAKENFQNLSFDQTPTWAKALIGVLMVVVICKLLDR